MKAVIYTQRVEIVECYGERRDCADQRIADFIGQCGYLPIPLPNNSKFAKQFIRSIQPIGIILTGGNSIELYGGDAPERDAMDRALIGCAIENDIPLYGFCRGMQSVLDYYGNVLMDVDGHVAVRHLIYEGNENYEVNSYHKQACIQLKSNCGLEVLAYAGDGVIEAVYHKDIPIIATMWHPERENPYNERDIKRVRKLFEG